jgi:hypothetical protein
MRRLATAGLIGVTFMSCGCANKTYEGAQAPFFIARECVVSLMGTPRERLIDWNYECGKARGM